MIRRVISILIALLGALLLYSWWQRGHEPAAPTLTPPATVLSDVGLAVSEEPVESGTPAQDEPPGESEDEPSETPAPDSATAGWTPTLVEFDRTDRNAPTVVLQRADAALSEGRLAEPPGDNAVDLFYSVLEAAPGNARAREGLGRTLDRIAADVEAALDRGDYPAAAQALPVLQQLRADDAGTLRLSERLQAVEPQRLALERAARALERGRLDTGRRNAASYYRQVLEEDPGNATAQNGLTVVQQRLIAEAQTQAQAGEFEAAEAILERAEAIDPGALQIMADARSSVAAERTNAASVLLTQAHEQLDQGEAAAAESLLEQALAIESDVSGAGLVRERIRNVRVYGGYGEGERFRDDLGNGDEGPVMVVVPVGSFLMGSPEDEAGRRANEGPQFRVRFDRGFAIAETEVTVAQFRRFVEATGHRTLAERNGNSTIYDERSGSMRERSGVDWRSDETGRPAGANNPVVHVDWNDASAYARWLAESTGRPYRLPSEAEFEYTLRAGSRARYAWGDGPPSGPVTNVSTAGDRSRARREWSNAFPGASDGFFGIAPVGSYPANDFGIRDMDGNVSEWVEDCWHSTYSRAPSDGHAWVNPGCSRRVVRGASWASGPEQVRSAYRLSIAPATTSPRVGFRVARGL